jgi:hypothetical protein
MRLRARRVVLFTFLHAVLTLALSVYAMTAGGIDHLEAPQRAASAEVAADVLMLPGQLLWTTWASKNLPNAVEWLLFLANSALWGLVLSAAMGMVSAGHIRRHPGRK